MKSPIGLLATLLLATTLRAQETWTPRTSGVTVPLWSVAQSAGQWVAVGEQGTILTSPDGAAWTPRTSGFPTRWLVGVGYGTPGGSGLWVVVGESGLILTSPDANTWTARRTAGTRINAVAWGNGTFVAGDDNGSTYFSLDGLAWSGPFASARSGFIRGLVYGAPHFVTTGLNNIQTTYDGQQSTGRGASTPQLQGTAYGRRLYFATGGANTYTSRDAITWTQQSGTTNVGVQGATFFNNQFVAVGNTGGIATTFDGSAWANRVSGTTQTLLAVAASAGSIVAVGSGGTILQSSAAPAAPTIAAQPAAVTEVPGGNVAFTVTARGSAPLTYQWRRDGVDLVGATADTLFLPAITFGQSGFYNCSVTNSAGTVVSAPAALNIVAGFPLPDPIDLSFTLGPSLNAAPRTAAVQPDGKIIIGGDFLFLNEGQAQFGLARLTANGALDSTFRPGAVTGGPIATIVLQPDGRILIGGTFTSISGVNRNGLARLNADGSLDPSFVPALSGALVLLAPSGQLHVSIFRLNSDGTRDPNWIFIPGSLGLSAIEEFSALALQADGKVILGQVTGSRIRHVSIRRLNPNGSNDLGFGTHGVGEGRTGFLGQLGALKVLPDGRVMASAITGLATIRLTADGNTDPTFTPFIDPTLSVSAVSFTSDGRTWFGGSFSSIAGTTRNQIARLNADGSLDATFNPGAGVFAANNATVAPAAILALDDGRALLLGNFARINTTARAQVARLNAQSLGDSNRPVVLSLDNYYREIRAGEGLTVQVNATGSPALTYGGNAFGSNLTGFATAAVVVPQPITQTSGPYTFFATNTAGNSPAQILYVRVIPSAPFILTQPLAIQINSGRPATLTVTSGGSSGLTYQWFKNGSALVGATSSTFTYANPQASDSGDYTVVIRNGLGFATSETVRLGVDETPRFVNIATRALAGRADAPLIAGFVVAGPGAKRVMIRASGPALAVPPFNVPGTLADPVLTVYNAAGTVLYTNDDWGTANDIPGIASAPVRLGAFPFPTGSADSGGILTLAPGPYTAVVTGKNNATGVALVEVYEDDNNSARLTNLSSRAFVGTEAALAIPGIVTRGGPNAKRLLVRAVGPGLAAFNVPALLADPFIAIINSAGATVATNNDWETNANLAALIVATNTVTFPLAAGSKDAALLVALPADSYTIQVTGAAGTTGNALVEIYELP